VPETEFPLLDAIEAILAWQRGPTDDRRRRIAATVGVLAGAAGATGAFLMADETVLPGLAVGWGTLAGGPPFADATGPTHAIELLMDGDAARTGILWLDVQPSRDAPAIRAVQLAIEAAWSRASASASAQRLEGLDAATRGIAGLLSLERVLQLIADRVRDLIGAEYAALGIVDEFGVIERFVTSGIDRDQRAAIGPLPRGHGLLGLIIRENRSYRIPHIGAHRASSGFPPNHPPMDSFLGVPIQVKGRSVGNFYLTNKRNAAEFSDSDQRLVELFAAHAGVAIENARLHEQVQQMAVVDERTRIGRDLHDGIIQAIYGVSLSLEDVPDLMSTDPAEATARVDRAIDALNLTIRDIRNFIFGLRPELADQGGILAGLASIGNELRLNSVIDVELRAPERVPELGEHRRGELLKVVREALSNVARHSGATRVLLTIEPIGDLLELVVADNGSGFAVDEDPGPSHQGLRNMRERVMDLGGLLEVRSVAGDGTRITIRVPATSDAGPVAEESES
jgi:signal transduction histidine kinase